MQDENVANFIPRIGLALWFESQQSNFLSAPGTLSTPHLSLPSPLFIHFILSCRPLVTYLPYYVDHAQISRRGRRDDTHPHHTTHMLCLFSFSPNFFKEQWKYSASQSVRFKRDDSPKGAVLSRDESPKGAVLMVRRNEREKKN